VLYLIVIISSFHSTMISSGGALKDGKVVCRRHGEPKTKTNPAQRYKETGKKRRKRTGCPFELSLSLKDDGFVRVVATCEQHNHPPALTADGKFLASAQMLKRSDREELERMRAAGSLELAREKATQLIAQRFGTTHFQVCISILLHVKALSSFYNSSRRDSSQD
jgi:hypothetical protein